MATESKKILIKYMNETLQFPLEPDGTLLLSTLQGAFAGVIGLSFLNTEGVAEVLKIQDNKIYINNNIDIYDARGAQSQ